MNAALWFIGGALLGVAVMSRIKPANESSCCKRVAIGGRDKIAGYAGPLSPLVGGALDALGLTDHIPGILDQAGVPYDS